MVHPARPVTMTRQAMSTPPRGPLMSVTMIDTDRIRARRRPSAKRARRSPSRRTSEGMSTLVARMSIRMSI